MGNIGKKKGAKVYTRMQAERAITRKEVDPAMFLDMEDPFKLSSNKAGQEVHSRNHPNKHVKNKAWRAMGCPVMSDPAEHAKFLAMIGVKEKVEVVEEQMEEESANEGE